MSNAISLFLGLWSVALTVAVPTLLDNRMGLISDDIDQMKFKVIHIERLEQTIQEQQIEIRLLKERMTSQEKNVVRGARIDRQSGDLILDRQASDPIIARSHFDTLVSDIRIQGTRLTVMRYCCMGSEEHHELIIQMNSSQGPLPTYSVNQIDKLFKAKADLTQLQSGLATKTNISDVYTQREIDDMLMLKATVTSLNQKADLTQLQSVLATKTNISDVYTQREIDDMLMLKATVTSLNQKPNRNEVPTIAQVQQLSDVLDQKPTQSEARAMANEEITSRTRAIYQIYHPSSNGMAYSFSVDPSVSVNQHGWVNQGVAFYGVVP